MAADVDVRPNPSKPDMDLIEILWKQDVDLGVSRDFFDFKSGEKNEESVIKKELEEPPPPKSPQPDPEPEELDPWEGFRYTIDSETGEHIIHGPAEEEGDNRDDQENTEDSREPSLDLPDEDREALLAELDRLSELLQDRSPQAADMYPADDSWQDIQSTAQRMTTSLGAAAVSAPPHNYTDPFSGVLLQNATLGPPPADMYPPSSLGTAVAASMATLTNGTEPSSIGDGVPGPTYAHDFPEFLYPNNATVTSAQGEYLLTDLLSDEDLHLMDMAAPAEGSYPVPMTTTEDRVDNSSDTGVSSMGSDRVPSISDQEWMDSCSESSSQTGDQDSYNSSDHHQYPTHPPVAQKKYKLFGKRPLSTGGADGGGFGDYSQEDHLGKHPEYLAVAGSYYSQSTHGNGLDPSLLPFGGLDPTSLHAYGDSVHHNHSYSIPPNGPSFIQRPIVRDKTLKETEEERISRDEKRARALQLPISNEDIIDLPIDEFNEHLAKHELTEAQLSLIRDIRRRGKNKVAAQNCRKRKLDQILTLQQEVDALNSERLQLESQRSLLLTRRALAQDKYAKLYQMLMQMTQQHNATFNGFPRLQPPALSKCNVSVEGDSEEEKGARAKRKAENKL